MIYFIRMKNEKHGYIFFSYLDEDSRGVYMATEKMKYAEEFETLEKATDFLVMHDKYNLFEVVDYYTANDEYYKE